MDFARSLTYSPLDSRPSSATGSIAHQIQQIHAQYPSAPSIATSGQTVLCALQPNTSNLVGYMVYRLVDQPTIGRTRRQIRFIDLQWIYVLPSFRNQKVGRILLSKLHPIAEKEKCEVVKAWFPKELEDEEYQEEGDRGKARKWMIRHGYDGMVTDTECYGSGEGEMVFHAVGMYD